MVAAKRGRGRGRPRGDGVDHISVLPDELLHSILLRVQSTARAVKTSVLSRRWRHIWTHVPAISLCDEDLASGSFIDRIEDILRAHPTPQLDRLEISVALKDEQDVARVNTSLRLASRRIAGELSMSIWLTSSPGPRAYTTTGKVIEVPVPVCERATAMILQVKLNMQLRFAAPGTFAALRVLTIHFFRIDADTCGNLERFVSKQCPSLNELTLLLVLRWASLLLHTLRLAREAQN